MGVLCQPAIVCYVVNASLTCTQSTVNPPTVLPSNIIHIIWIDGCTMPACNSVLCSECISNMYTVHSQPSYCFTIQYHTHSLDWWSTMSACNVYIMDKVASSDLWLNFASLIFLNLLVFRAPLLKAFQRLWSCLWRWDRTNSVLYTMLSFMCRGRGAQNSVLSSVVSGCVRFSLFEEFKWIMGVGWGRGVGGRRRFPRRMNAEDCSRWDCWHEMICGIYKVTLLCQGLTEP